MSGWDNYVAAAQSHGFRKVTIINRQTFHTLAFSNKSHVATVWKDSKNYERDCNENDELINITKKKKVFRFYGGRYIIDSKNRAEDGTFLSAVKEKDTILCVRQFCTIWFIVETPVNCNPKRGFADSTLALKAIQEGLWNTLADDGL